MRRILFLLSFLLTPNLALSELASTSYVDRTTSEKLDLTQSANQTLQGNYTVSGSFKVPTPPLPTPE